MNRRLGIAFILTTLAILGNVQYAFGGAVMSVDMGSEYTKVS